MPTRTETLYQSYADLIDALTDAMLQAEAFEHLDAWKSARVAHLSLIAGTLSSYSLAGRSYTKRNPDELRTAADAELAQVREILGHYGSGVALVDFSDGRVG